MNQPLSYKDAGVDIDAGDALVERIKPLARKTLRPGVLAGIGGFGALFEVPKHYREPVMVSGTDGVGTKLKLAFEWNMHDTVGIDLVGMSVNDILVQGAEPLFFLDYFACGKLHVDTAAQVVAGIASGCEASGCALIGGKPPKCRACTRRANTIWLALRSAWSKNRPSWTVGTCARVTPSWACRPTGFTPTGFLWCAK